MIKYLLRPMVALRIAAVLTLIGLAFMVWSILVPTPLPIMLAMSVGQGFGTTAFALYLFVVLRAVITDYRTNRKVTKDLLP